MQVSELLGAVEELRTAKMELLNQAAELRSREEAARDERDEMSVCLPSRWLGTARPYRIGATAAKRAVQR